MFTVSEENTVKCLGGSSDIFANGRTSFIFKLYETVRTFGFVFSHEVPTDVF